MTRERKESDMEQLVWPNRNLKYTKGLNELYLEKNDEQWILWYNARIRVKWFSASRKYTTLVYVFLVNSNSSIADFKKYLST